MISKIKKWISNKRLAKGIGSLDVIPTALAPVAQEDSRVTKAIAEVNKAFDRQHKKLMRMSLIPHEADCDFINCKKAVCFKFPPDKIVEGSRTVVDRTKGSTEKLDFYD